MMRRPTLEESNEDADEVFDVNVQHETHPGFLEWRCSLTQFSRQPYIPGIFIPASLLRETRFAHLLEHLLHLRVLAKQVIHFLHGRARSAGDAFAAVAVDDFMMIAFVRRSSN